MEAGDSSVSMEHCRDDKITLTWPTPPVDLVLYSPLPQSAASLDQVLTRAGTVSEELNILPTAIL